MRKVMYFILMIMFLSLVTGCDIGYGTSDFKSFKLSIDQLEYNEIDEYNKSAKINYYDNIKDLEKLNNNIFIKYDEDYFKDNSLVVITLKDYEENIYSISGIKNGTIAINREIFNNFELTDWTFILEIIGKAPDIENFRVYFNNYYNNEPHSHNYQKSVVEPTCQEQGYIQYKCECGEIHKSDYTKIVDCKYKDGKCIWCSAIESNNKYKLSPNYHELTTLTINTVDYVEGGSNIPLPFASSLKLYNLQAENRLDEIKILDMIDEFDDYYTCCYVDKSYKSDLDSIKTFGMIEFEEIYPIYNWGIWSGKEFYFVKLYIYINKNYNDEGIKHFINDCIKWYEIPKYDTIPQEIENSFLIAITESKNIKELSLDGNIESQYKAYFESKHLYEETIEYPQYDEFYNDWINQKYLTYGVNGLRAKNNVLIGLKVFEFRRTNCFQIKLESNIEYILFLYNSLWGNNYLSEIYEYKEEMLYDAITDTEIQWILIEFDEIYNLLKGD